MNNKRYAGELTLALPKQEKLKTPIAEMFRLYGLELIEDENEGGMLVDPSRNIPSIRVEFVRAADALFLMERGVADMAIIGSDVMQENTNPANPRYKAPVVVKDIDMAVCKFQLAVPENQKEDYRDPSSLNGKRIATSYPNMLGAWLDENGVKPKEILVREGGVESSVRLGIADVVADLVDTGGTLRRNKLVPAFDIARTSAVLYAADNLECLKSLKVQEFKRRLASRGKNEATETVEMKAWTPEMVAA